METVKFGIGNETPPTGKMNFLQRVVGIITSPAEVMKDLSEKPRILFPILVAALGTLIFYLLRLDLFKEFSTHVVELGLEQSNQAMTPQQVEAAKSMGWWITLIATPFTGLFQWFISATVMFGLAKLLKGEGKYKQYLSVVGYSSVVIVLSLLITFAVSFFTNSIMLDSSLANLTNLFAPGLKGSFLYGIIRGIDLFIVWQYCVIGIGIAVVSKLSKAKAYGIAALLCAVYILMSANSLRML